MTCNTDKKLYCFLISATIVCAFLQPPTILIHSTSNLLQGHAELCPLKSEFLNLYTANKHMMYQANFSATDAGKGEGTIW